MSLNARHNYRAYAPGEPRNASRASQTPSLESLPIGPSAHSKVKWLNERPAKRLLVSSTSWSPAGIPRPAELSPINPSGPQASGGPSRTATGMGAKCWLVPAALHAAGGSGWCCAHLQHYPSTFNFKKATGGTKVGQNQRLLNKPAAKQ